MLSHHVLGLVEVLGAVPDPDPQAPPNVDEPVSTLISYLKWGVLLVILAAGLVGAGAIAGGRVFSHHGASKIGIGILLSALGGAVVYVSIYAIITSITG